MGKLVLTRRAGESVKLTEPNGDRWLLTVYHGNWTVGVSAHIEAYNFDKNVCASKTVKSGETLSFAGGNVELRPHKRPDQAILAFDFPRDVTIVRTEIA